MGYFSSSTTQKTEIAPPSPEELEYMSVLNGLMLSQIAEAGYIPKAVEKTTYQDESKANSYKAQISTIDKQIAELKKDIEINPIRPGGTPGWRGASTGDIQDGRARQLNQLEGEKFKVQQELNAIPQTTFTDYTIEKEEDPRVRDAIEKYGPDAQQVRDMRAQISQEEVYSAESSAQITKDYLDKMKKLVNGDYSYTDQQKAQTAKYFEPIRETLTKTTDLLLDEADTNQANLFEYVNSYMNEIERTGIDTLDALNASLIQVEKSGQELMKIAQGVNEKYENKAKFEFDLLSQQADEKAANQAALLGLPPGSMVEKKQASAMKYNALQSVLLDMELQEANRALGVAEKTEGDKKQISLAKADLALQQGGKKEALAGTSLNIAQQAGQQKMNAKSAYAQSLLGIEQDQMNLLYNAAVGQLPQQASAAQGYMGFGEQMQSSNIGQLNTPADIARSGYQTEAQKQMAQTTTTTTSRPSVFSSIAGGIGALSGAAQGIMSGIGAMNPVAPIVKIGVK